MCQCHWKSKTFYNFSNWATCQTLEQSLIKDVIMTVVVKLFWFHLFLKFVLCAHAWVCTLTGPAKSEKVKQLTKLGCGSKIHRNKKFSIVIDTFYYHLWAKKKLARGWGSIHCRKVADFSWTCYSPYPSLLWCQRYLIICKKKKLWKVGWVFGLCNLPLNWSDSV